jgi:hypothetical protein
MPAEPQSKPEAGALTTAWARAMGFGSAGHVGGPAARVAQEDPGPGPQRR